MCFYYLLLNFIVKIKINNKFRFFKGKFRFLLTFFDGFFSLLQTKKDNQIRERQCYYFQNKN